MQGKIFNNRQNNKDRNTILDQNLLEPITSLDNQLQDYNKYFKMNFDLRFVINIPNRYTLYSIILVHQYFNYDAYNMQRLQHKIYTCI